jgi:hypothetical protein
MQKLTELATIDGAASLGVVRGLLKMTHIWGKNSFILFHHLLVESNIMSMKKNTGDKLWSGVLHQLKHQGRIDRKVCALYMCTKRRIQYSNHEAGLCKKVSKNRKYRSCFRFIHKLLISLPVRKNENII